MPFSGTPRALEALTIGFLLLSFQRSVGAKCLDPAKEIEGQQHLDLANAAYDERAFTTSLQEYRAVYELCRSAMALYGIAHSEAELGQETNAARDFERFLREADDAGENERGVAKESLQAISERLVLLDLGGAMDGAAVSIDGRVVAWRAGVPIYLPPGPHTLRVEGGAAHRFEHVVSDVGGAHVHVDVPSAATLAAVAGGSSAAPAPAAAPRRRWWLWGGLAAVVVAGAVTGYIVTRPDRPACPSLCP